jgi:hypothetical protein
MCASFRLLDEKAAEFVARARDEKNYYLIRLTGEKFPVKEERLKLQAFAVRGGEKMSMRPRAVRAESKFLVEEIRGKRPLQIEIKVRGSEVNVWLYSREGQLLLGPATFVDEGFGPKAGRPGFVMRDGGKVEFDLGSAVVIKPLPSSHLCAPARPF